MKTVKRRDFQLTVIVVLRLRFSTLFYLFLKQVDVFFKIIILNIK